MIKLLHGDCLELMKDIPDKSIDMILCDLPYGTTACKWDVVIPSEPLWEQYKRIIKENGIIVLFATLNFGIQLINSNYDWFKYDLVWNKNVPTGMSYAKYRPMRYHENILIFYKNRPVFNKIMKPRVGEKKECYKGYNHYCGDSNHHDNFAKIAKQYNPDFVNPSSVLSFNVVPNRKGKLHPTQKPVELLEWLIKSYTLEGETVLDNCMGSGSTGVACINLNRNFIGIEKDDKYLEIAKNRIYKAQQDVAPEV